MIENQLILQYLKAMTSLYGIIPARKALEIINSQNSGGMTVAELDSVDLEGTFVEREGDLFIHEALFADECVEDMLATQGNKPFFVPDKSELLKYADGEYCERPQAFDDLKGYLVRECGVQEQVAEDICEDIHGQTAIGGNSIKAALYEVERRRVNMTGIEQMNRLIRHITELINNTRNWDHRGFTARELFEKFEKPNLLPLPVTPFEFGGRDRPGLDHDWAEDEKLALDYVRALVNLYGVVEKGKVVEIFNAQNPDSEKPLSVTDLDVLVGELNPDHEIFIIEDDLFVEESLLMEEEDLPRLMARQKGKPYYIPDKEILLRYVDDLYRERPPSFTRLQSFIQKHLALDPDAAEELCEDIHLGFVNADFSVGYVLFDVERRRLKFINETHQREFVRLALDLANHSRIWSNRGFTPTELMDMNERPGSASRSLPQSQSQSRKVGRNDPCPCGSGKKYKQCCGR